MLNDKFLIKNKHTGEYLVEKGKTTPNKNLATILNEDQAARFLRKTKHPTHWEKEKI